MKDLKKTLEERIRKEFDALDKATTEKEKDGILMRIKTLTETLKEQHQSKFENWFQWLKLGIELIGIGAPLIFYGIWMNRGLKFEETGTINSHVFKGLVSKFKVTK